MKIEETTIVEPQFKIETIINKTAIVKFSNNQIGLYNITKGELIGNSSNYISEYKDKGNLIIQIDSNKNVRIYDTLEEVMLIEYYLLDTSLDNMTFDYLILKNKDTGLKKLFDIRHPEMINDDYTNIDILCNIKGFLYLVMDIANKKGIYTRNIGFITDITYDAIINYKNFLVLIKGEDKYFINKRNMHNIIGPFNEIYINHFFTNEYSFKDDFIYGISDDLVCVYEDGEEECLFKYPCDKLDILTLSKKYNSKENIYYFKTYEDNKRSLIKYSKIFKEETNTYEYSLDKLIDNVDKIKYEDNIFKYSNDKLNGLYIPEINELVDSLYTGFDIINNNLIALYNDTISIINKIPYEYITDVDNFIVFNNSIIYKKNSLFGYIYSKNNRYFNTNPLYDEIKSLGNDFFIIKKDHKVGLIYQNKIIYSPVYDEIRVCDKSVGIYRTNYIFILKNNNKYEITSIKDNNILNKEPTNMSNIIYNKVSNYKDILVLNDDTSTYIYDYQGNLLNKLDRVVSINEIIANNDEIYYRIDNDIYCYKKDLFIKCGLDDFLCYIKEYETKDYQYIIKSYSKKAYDEFIALIASADEDFTEEMLNILLNEKDMLEQNYPKVNLTKVRKI